MIVYLNINETTQKKQLNFSTTAIKILSQSFLKSNPPPSAVLIPNYKTIGTYKNHPSIVNIKRNVLPNSLNFDLPPDSQDDINKIVKSLKASKATGPE